ncbi:MULTISPECIES: site-specific integrase [Mycetohabitans]|uniref:site-specific integrase n=1 Tax=Mycetohabitans TaxID=2571159 RepID=UPI001F297FB9|nr:tyrosine-type recombinase/integrase [Mycetohabitans sp. B3]MCF2133816.1 tyrosine-type recombinase/integrase [Mycetohabitans sp. B3]
MTKTDLFAAQQRTDWDRAPIQSFEAWLARQPGRRTGSSLQPSTAKVYLAQWRAFVRYLNTRHLPLSAATSDTINAFLASLHHENRDQRLRYRKLIERVFIDINACTRQQASINPAVGALRDSQATWKRVKGNQDTDFLSPQERQHIIDTLLSPVADTYYARWHSLRDRALVATFLGAGLKVSQAIKLTVNCINIGPDRLMHITTPGSRFSHQPRPEPFAQSALAHWLVERHASGVNSPWVFPGARDGRPMHAVTALRATEAIVRACRLSATRQARTSPQTLRNSYIAALFEAGQTTLAVSEVLGVELITAERLKKAWQKWARKKSV